MNAPIRVLLADDHMVVRQALCKTLSADAEIAIVGEASDGDEAQRISLETQPDLLLLDLSMRGASAKDTVELLKQESPETKVLIVTAHDDMDYITSMMQAGVAGYLLKEEGPDSLHYAIYTIYDGGTWFSDDVLAKYERWQLEQAGRKE